MIRIIYFSKKQQIRSQIQEKRPFDSGDNESNKKTKIESHQSQSIIMRTIKPIRIKLTEELKAICKKRPFEEDFKICVAVQKKARVED